MPALQTEKGCEPGNRTEDRGHIIGNKFKN